MAISPLEFKFLYLAFGRGLFVPGGNILEFGEAHTHELDVAEAVRLLLPEGPERNDALAAVAEAQARDDRMALAQLIYRAAFKYTSYTAIDLEPGGSHRIQQDLNQPFDLGTRYDVCINNGTSEHVFNLANIFKAIHDHTRTGGLMMHWTPSLGWVDHGLYNVQPKFFYDLARANDYEVCLSVLGGNTGIIYPLSPTVAITRALIDKHPDLRDAEAFAILRKTVDRPFRYPIQGAYRELDKFANPSVG